MRLFFEGFEGCCLFGLCDAMLFALFLCLLADIGILLCCVLVLFFTFFFFLFVL